MNGLGNTRAKYVKIRDNIINYLRFFTEHEAPTEYKKVLHLENISPYLTSNQISLMVHLGKKTQMPLLQEEALSFDFTKSLPNLHTITLDDPNTSKSYIYDVCSMYSEFDVINPTENKDLSGYYVGVNNDRMPTMDRMFHARNGNPLTLEIPREFKKLSDKPIDITLVLKAIFSYFGSDIRDETMLNFLGKDLDIPTELSTNKNCTKFTIYAEREEFEAIFSSNRMNIRKILYDVLINF
jgi:hypothetical protein